MVEKEINYSLLYFTPVFNEKTEFKLMSLIYQGVKVILFTFDSLEEYEKKDTWKEAKQKRLLEWWEIPYKNEWDHHPISFIDGIITYQTLFDYICENSKFNKEQYLIEHDHSGYHLMVTAGAGTGKTTVMINRLLYLMHMKQNLNFNEITMITFTNEATLNMRKKLTGRIMEYYEFTKVKKYLKWFEEVEFLHVSTIHGYAKYLLEQVGRELGFPSFIRLRGFQQTKKDLIEHGIDLFAKEFPNDYIEIENFPQYQIVRSVLYLNQILENKSVSLKKLESLSLGDDSFSKFLKFLLIYLSKELIMIKEEKSEWEINDLIRELGQLTKVENIKEKVTAKFIMVDEFQDTDESQVQFLLWLVDQLQCEFFIVGDIKQSIYRFRGADYTAFQQIIDGFRAREAFFREYDLVKNYRSSKTLIESMNPLFKQWSSRIGQFPYTNKDYLIPMVNEKSEGLILLTDMQDPVLKQLLKRLQGEEAVILLRTNYDVQQMILKIEQLGFFAEGERKGDFFRSIPVREFYILIRSLINNHLPTKYYAFHRSSYGDNHLSNFDLINNFDPERSNYLFDLVTNQPDWIRWQGYIQKLNQKPLLEVINHIIYEIHPAKVYSERFIRERNGLTDRASLLQEARVRYLEYSLNLEHLLYLIHDEFGDRVITLYNLEKFIRDKMNTDTEELSLSVSEDKKRHRFRCMTVHKAKGLEFDHVLLPITNHQFIRDSRPQALLREQNGAYQMGYRLFIQDTRFENTLFREMNRLENEEMIGEEARLLYVALTRAKKSLFFQTPISLANPTYINKWSDLLQMGATDYVQS